MPPIDGLADTPYWTNRDVVKLTELPGSLVVVGGGAIGAELSQAFAGFGVTVTVVEMADRIVAVEEPEASKALVEAFGREGIQVLTGAAISSVAYADGVFSVRTADHTLTAERLLVAAGRQNNIRDIGLDSVGLDPDVKVLETDERLRAGDRLWAIGDITGRGAFTHVSMYQARVVLRDILGEDGPWADYRAVSRVTFTDPEVGSVGLTEQQARDAGLPVGVSVLEDLGARGWLARSRGLIKLVADTDRGILVGATAVGPSGGEVLSLLAAAVHAEIPIKTLLGMHFAYPTYHRAIETALLDLV